MYRLILFSQTLLLGLLIQIVFKIVLLPYQTNKLLFFTHLFLRD